MINKIFKVSTEDHSELVVDHDALRFGFYNVQTAEEFIQKDKKRGSLLNGEIQFSAIKSIIKEDDDKTIKINYSKSLGIPGSREFSFSDQSDNDIFFDYLENQKKLIKSREKLTSFKASLAPAIALPILIYFTYDYYSAALAIKNGEVVNKSDLGDKISNYIIGLLGTTGVLIVGSLLSLTLIYIIIDRFRNPPYITKFTPPSVG